MTYWIIGYLLLSVVASIFILLIAKYDPRERKSLTGTAIENYLYPDGKPLGLRVQEWMGDWLVPVFIFLSVMASWPVLLSVVLYARLKVHYFPDTQPETKDEGETEEESATRFYARAGNLIEEITVEDVEAREQIIDPLEAVPPIPFGHLNRAWCSLKAAMQPGDELWFRRASR